MTYILVGICILQLFAIAVLVLAVSASKEVIEDLQQSLRYHKGEH